MGSFDDRLAEARASEEAADASARQAAAQAAQEVADARTRALELRPAVAEAVGAVARLPLPGPHKATESDYRWNSRGAILRDELGSNSVYIIDVFDKPRFGKTGTVTPVGWSFSTGFVSYGQLLVRVFRDRPATFSLSHPHVDFGIANRSLEEICEVGRVRWQSGSYKDSGWQAGVIFVDRQLDQFLDLAAKLVTKLGA